MYYFKRFFKRFQQNSLSVNIPGREIGNAVENDLGYGITLEK